MGVPRAVSMAVAMEAAGLAVARAVEMTGLPRVVCWEAVRTAAAAWTVAVLTAVAELEAGCEAAG